MGIPVLVAATVAAGIASAELPAGADPEVIIDELVTEVDETGTIVSQPITFSSDGVVIETDNAAFDSSCLVSAGDEQVCFGETQSQDYLAGIHISSTATEEEEAVASAFDWIEREGVLALASKYDVPDDGRIETYLRGELRGYVFNRVTDILDKVAYNVDLSDDEERTLAFLEQRQIEEDRNLARWSLDEYNLWKAQGCAYTAPAAPAFVTSPVLMPNDVTLWCNRARSQLDTLLTFAPPMPSVNDFRTWATYRHAPELDLGLRSTQEYQRNLAAMRGGLMTLSAGVAGAGVGGVLAGMAGASVALAQSITAALNIAVTTTTSLGEAITVGSSAATLGSAIAAVGASVAVVILAIAIAVQGILQLVAAAAVGEELVATVNGTQASTDPFGVRALAATNVGTTLAQARAGWKADPSTVPPYRAESIGVRLVNSINGWLTTTGSGVPIPDPTGVWPDNATGTDDYRFQQVVGSTSTVVNQITVPIDGGGTQTVRFDRGWFIITPQGGQPRAALAFDYVDNTGQPVVAMRAPGGGFVLARNGETGVVASAAPLIQWTAGNGTSRTASLVEPGAGPSLGELHPAVAGPRLPGRPHNLRPNPVDQDGDFNSVELVDNYTYDWELRRFDPAANGGTGAFVAGPALEDVAQGGNPTFGARFTPTATGEYEATVTATSESDPDDMVVGIVRFTIDAPEPAFAQLDLVEDPVDGELRVDAQLTETVPSDDIDLTVQWPGIIGSDDPRPESSVQLECFTDLFTCSTVDTGLDVGLSEALSHELDVDSDLRQEVVVTANNQYGVVATDTLTIDPAAWPSFAEGDPPAGDQPGTVAFDPEVTTVRLPISVPGADPNYDVARLVPANGAPTATFQLIDPATGDPVQAFLPIEGDPSAIVSIEDRSNDGSDWVIVFRDLPSPEQLGSHSIPIIVQEVGGGRATMELQVDVIAAQEDAFRGGLLTDLDPLDIGVDALPTVVSTVLGGRSGEVYQGELCVSLTSPPADPVEFCADNTAFTDPDGGGRFFPWLVLAPNGIEVGPHQVQAWVPAGDRTDPAPIEVSFVATENIGVPPSFTDVAEESPFFEDVEWLSATGVTTGFADGSFRPGQAVSRQAMAAFLYRMAGLPVFEDPPTRTFEDVPRTSQFFSEIEWMAATGISTGTPASPRPLFKPANPVSRQAMAAFLYRLAGEPSFTPPGEASFGDVPTTNAFFAEIEWMAEEGISTGSPADPLPLFKPRAAVSRGAMAAFLHRLFEGPGVDPDLLDP